MTEKAGAMLSRGWVVVGAAAVLLSFASASAENAAPHFPDPMILFVAKGKPNACGLGCSEWIAADGTFDGPGVEQRFREFFASLQGRDLPIFFNSRGGTLREALKVGLLLRERRMTAAVGKTFPDGCRSARDASCRRRMQSGREMKADLRSSDAICHSACVFALIGASVRHVGTGTRVGVHAGRQIDPKARPSAETVEQTRTVMRRYSLLMGVSPRLYDLAVKTPFNRMHILSRDEIAQLGIETRGAFETEWLSYEDSAVKRQFMLKAITQARGPEGKEYRTTIVSIFCGGGAPALVYQRELPSNEVDVPTTIRLSIGHAELRNPFGASDGKIDRHSLILGRDFVSKALEAGSIMITETFSPPNAPEWSREVKMVAAGLERGKDTVLAACSEH